MPLYCTHFQQVFLKDKITEKYPGGIEKFKEKYQWSLDKDHEDERLISLTSMDNGYHTPEGLQYNRHAKTSKDFVVVSRYAESPLSWDVDWLEMDGIFIWHKGSLNKQASQKMNAVTSKTADELDEHYDKTGEWLLRDIV